MDEGASPDRLQEVGKSNSLPMSLRYVEAAQVVGDPVLR